MRKILAQIISIGNTALMGKSSAIQWVKVAVCDTDTNWIFLIVGVPGWGKSSLCVSHYFNNFFPKLAVKNFQ